jgi:hypothetical protein
MPVKAREAGWRDPRAGSGGAAYARLKIAEHADQNWIECVRLATRTLTDLPRLRIRADAKTESK